MERTSLSDKEERRRAESSSSEDGNEKSAPTAATAVENGLVAAAEGQEMPGLAEESKEEHTLAKEPTTTSQAGSAAGVTTRDDGTDYPHGIKLGLITIALLLSVLCIAIDNSIIATAIPKITDEFNSLADVGWYGSAYLLTTSSLQLLFGKFYSYFDVKRVYLIAIFFFELGSLICGVANSSVTLIIGRAIAGVGSAGIFSGAIIILAHSVPLRTRPLYSGAIGAAYGISSVLGPLLGGAFTDHATWRWCFYINLPLGAITIGVIAIFFKAPAKTVGARNVANHADGAAKKTLWQHILEFDPFGTAVFMPAIICLLLALQWGGTTYAWKDGRIIALFVLFGVLIAAFLAIQWKQQERATVPPRIVGKRTVWAAAVFSFCLGSAFLSLIYFLPLWFQAVKGASAVESGIMNLPMLLGTVIFSVTAGILVTVFGYFNPFMILGSVLVPIGVGLLSTMTPDSGSGMWIGFQAIAGAGIGFSMQQPMLAVQVVLDIKDVPVGTSFVIFMQTLGGALFVSISQNVFSNFLVKYTEQYVPGIDPAVVLGTGATAIQSSIPKEFLAGVTLAYNDALTKVFLIGAAVSALSVIGTIFVEWKSVKGKNVGGLA